jgi:hypothetical protein
MALVSVPCVIVLGLIVPRVIVPRAIVPGVAIAPQVVLALMLAAGSALAAVVRVVVVPRSVLVTTGALPGGLVVVFAHAGVACGADTGRRGRAGIPQHARGPAPAQRGSRGSPRVDPPDPRHRAQRPAPAALGAHPGTSREAMIALQLQRRPTAPRRAGPSSAPPPGAIAAGSAGWTIGGLRRTAGARATRPWRTRCSATRRPGGQVADGARASGRRRTRRALRVSQLQSQESNTQ